MTPRTQSNKVLRPAIHFNMIDMRYRERPNVSVKHFARLAALPTALRAHPRGFGFDFRRDRDPIGWVLAPITRHIR